MYAHGRVLKKVSSDILIDELFHEVDRWIEAGMPRPKRLKLAKPAALAMARRPSPPRDGRRGRLTPLRGSGSRRPRRYGQGMFLRALTFSGLARGRRARHGLRGRQDDGLGVRGVRIARTGRRAGVRHDHDRRGLRPVAEDGEPARAGPRPPGRSHQLDRKRSRGRGPRLGGRRPGARPRGGRRRDRREGADRARPAGERGEARGARREG